MSIFDRLKNLFGNGNDSKKKEDNAPAAEKAEEAPVNEVPAAPAAAEPAPAAPAENVNETTAPAAASGSSYLVRYDKSFEARLCLSDDELKGYYNEVKKAFLSCAGVKARLSWKGELFTRGHAKLGDLRVRGKSLYLYLALDPAELEGTKFRGEEASDAKALADMPFCYVINGERKAVWACELIDRVCEKFGAVKGEAPTADFAAAFPSASEEELIDRLLIKELVTKCDKPALYGKPESIPTDGIETFRTDKLFREYASVTLEQVSANFADGETVDLAALVAKNLVPASADAWRLLGQGSLDKKLTVKTNYCTMATAGKITANGGKVEIYKSTTRFGGQ